MTWMATRPFAGWSACTPAYTWKFTVDTAVGIDPVVTAAGLVRLGLATSIEAAK